MSGRAQSRTRNGHPSIWGPLSMVLNSGSQEQAFFLCVTDSPMKRLGKWNYFKHAVQIKKVNTDKNNLYLTCTQNWEVPVSCRWCTEMRERAPENSVYYSVLETPLIKWLLNQWHNQSQNFKCAWCLLNLLQTYEKFSLRRRVPLTE